MSLLCLLIMAFCASPIFGQEERAKKEWTIGDDEWQDQTRGKNYKESFQERSKDRENAQRDWTVDDETWKDRTERVDYSESFKEFEGDESDLDSPSIPQGAVTEFAVALRYTLYAVVIGLLVFLLIRYVDWNKLLNDRGRNKVNDVVEIDLEQMEEEEDIRDMALDHALEEYLAKKDFRTALRIQYLKLLQLLAELDMIKWEKDKTNGDYIREINSYGEKQLFRQNTRAFERAWYGDIAISESEYHNVSRTFGELTRMLTPKPVESDG